VDGQPGTQGLLPVERFQYVVDGKRCRSLARGKCLHSLHKLSHRHAFPVGMFRAAKRRDARIGPHIAMVPVIRGVDDKGVVGDTQLVELIQLHSPMIIVFHHGIDLKALSAPDSARRKKPGARRCSSVLRSTR